MNTYTLKINSVECQTSLGDLTNVIKNVHWTYEVTNGTESAYINQKLLILNLQSISLKNT